MQGVNSLHPSLKAFRETWNPDQPYESQWLDDLHNHIMTLTDEDTFLNPEWNTLEDEGRLPEHDVIEMTDEMYSELFNGPEPNTDTWFIGFVRRKRTQ